MLDWLSKLFGRPHPRTTTLPRVTSPGRVLLDERIITVDDGVGSVASLAWAELASVTVLTTTAGPFGIDLFWVLADRDGRQILTVPMGAAGEHALLKAMQARLTGFDNMAVVEAMSSTEASVFQIWPAAEMV